jgi:hypothetical protein
MFGALRGKCCRSLAAGAGDHPAHSQHQVSPLRRSVVSPPQKRPPHFSHFTISPSAQSRQKYMVPRDAVLMERVAFSPQSKQVAVVVVFMVLPFV